MKADSVTRGAHDVDGADTDTCSILTSVACCLSTTNSRLFSFFFFATVDFLVTDKRFDRMSLAHAPRKKVAVLNGRRRVAAKMTEQKCRAPNCNYVCATL